MGLERERPPHARNTERIKKHKSRTTLNSRRESPVDENKSPYNDYSTVKQVLDFDRAEYQRHEAPKKSRILSMVEDFSANTSAFRESANSKGFVVENTESTINADYEISRPLEPKESFINRQSQSMIDNNTTVNRSNTIIHKDSSNRFKFRVAEHKSKMYREIRPVKANPFSSF